MSTSVTITGLNCEACQKVIAMMVGKIPGVSKVNVDLKTGKTDIEADRAIDKKTIIDSLKGTHYKVL